jgi:cytochrome c oxidase cbb3-type subunit 1
MSASDAAAGQVEIFNYGVVRQFTIATVFWGIGRS